MQDKNFQHLKTRVQQAAKGTKVRFILVGISNTLIDFVFFNILVLTFLSQNHIAANIVSTTIAMAFSYMMNKQAVFRNKKPHSALQMALFLAVTLTGIWVIQTLIMDQVFLYLQDEFAAEGHPVLVWFLLNIAKCFGIAAGAMWNYFGYSRIVFRTKAAARGNG